MAHLHKSFSLLLVSLLVLATLTASGAPVSSATPALAQMGQETMPDGLMSAFLAASTSTPLISYQQKIIASGSAYDNLGYSVALSGDTALVGAHLASVGANSQQGAAYVFIRIGTTWSLQAKLTAPDGAAGDFFGRSVAISGNTALVGSYQAAIGANSHQGAAYVFIRSGTDWSLQQKLIAPDGTATDLFGFSAALLGDTALVGAYCADLSGQDNQGAAYAFTRSGNVWSMQQKLVAMDPGVGDLFGWSVSLSADTALVGAGNDDVGKNTDQGSAYIFSRSGTTWTQQAKLIASDGAGSDAFGSSVALSEGTALIGAPGADVNGNIEQGAAYIFTPNRTTWSQQAKLTAPDGAASDYFGMSVAISGDTTLVGSDGADIGVHGDQGSAYVFTPSGATWSLQQKLIAPNGAPADSFGRSAALSGNTALVGAPLGNIGKNNDQGTVNVFTRSLTTWSQQQELSGSDGASDDTFGFSVSLSGNTALLGVPGNDIGPEVNQGSAYVFTLSGTVWVLQQKLTALDGSIGDNFGRSVSLLGDTALVGAYADDIGSNTAQGSAYVFTRSGTTWTQQTKLTAPDGATNDYFGLDVALSGNTALVGAYNAAIGGNPAQGAAYVFTRSGNLWSYQAKLTALDGAANDRFGQSVALEGDTALVGAPYDDNGLITDQGSAYIFDRLGTTWTQRAKLTSLDGAAGDEFGVSVVLSGGTALVGAYCDDVGSNVDQGSAYVFTGSGTTWTQQARLTAIDGAAFDKFGLSLALYGDIALVGSYQDDVGSNVDQGSAYVFLHSGTLWLQQGRWTAPDSAAGDNFGFSVALSGVRALMGSPADDIGATTDQGSAYFYNIAFPIFLPVILNSAP